MNITTPEVIAWLSAQLETVKGRTLCTELRYSIGNNGQHALCGWLNYDKPNVAHCIGIGNSLNEALDNLNRDAAQRQKLISDMMPLDEATVEAIHD